MMELKNNNEKTLVSEGKNRLLRMRDGSSWLGVRKLLQKSTWVMTVL
jgi:hypothetical protein